MTNIAVVNTRSAVLTIVVRVTHSRSQVMAGRGGFVVRAQRRAAVCYVGRPQPLGTGCRCDVPGFGLKRGNIEG